MSNWVINYFEFEGAGNLDLFNGEENPEFSAACFDVVHKDENILEFVSHWEPNLPLALEVSYKMGNSIKYSYNDTARYCSGQYQIDNGVIISQQHWSAEYGESYCPYDCWDGITKFEDLDYNYFHYLLTFSMFSYIYITHQNIYIMSTRKQQCNIRLDAEQFEELKDLFKKNKITISAGIRALVNDYLKFYKYNNKNGI